jgi:rhodanese-related sulfurtransferase
MGARTRSISSDELYARLGTASAPVLLDVRRDEAFGNDKGLIIGAFHRAPEQVESWSKYLVPDHAVVAYCVHGHEVSQGVAALLHSAGVKASYLEGGIAAWRAAGLPTRRNLGAVGNKWVTREHPKIDRIACPWLISRFINPLAEFLYVPVTEVIAVAKAQSATAYDIKDAKFGHVGDRCSFDAIVRLFEIKDPALDHLATIVRGADTSRPALAPQCEGLLAISHGLSANHHDDHEMLKHGMIIYDALYTWCRMHGVKSHDTKISGSSRGSGESSNE